MVRHSAKGDGKLPDISNRKQGTYRGSRLDQVSPKFTKCLNASGQRCCVWRKARNRVHVCFHRHGNPDFCALERLQMRSGVTEHEGRSGLDHNRIRWPLAHGRKEFPRYAEPFFLGQIGVGT